jgi:hypothetical protein
LLITRSSARDCQGNRRELPGARVGVLISYQNDEKCCAVIVQGEDASVACASCAAGIGLDYERRVARAGLEGHWLTGEIDPEACQVVVSHVPAVPRFILLHGFTATPAPRGRLVAPAGYGRPRCRLPVMAHAFAPNAASSATPSCGIGRATVRIVTVKAPGHTAGYAYPGRLRNDRPRRCRQAGIRLRASCDQNWTMCQSAE